MVKVRRRDKVIVLLILLGVIAAALFFWSRNRLSAETAIPPKPISVITVQPQKNDVARSLRVPAILEPAGTVALIPRVPGMILDIRAEEGDEVGLGDLLALIDPQPYELELLAAESSWKLSENRLERTKSLFESSGASQQQLEEARTGRDAAYSSYKLAKMRREYAELRAPSNGVVLSRLADPGSMASVEHPLFIIGDSAPPQVKLRLPEKYWDIFSGDQKPSVRIFRPAGSLSESTAGSPSQDPVYEAQILRIGSSISPQTKTFEVLCALVSSERPWPIGSRLSVEFQFDKHENTWSLPIKALSGNGFLWWIDPSNGTAQRLEAGDFFHNENYVVVPAVWAERHFITDGYERLYEGQTVSKKPSTVG